MAVVTLKWLVYRRDQHGNLDVVKLPIWGRERYCWNLSQSEADKAIADLHGKQSKPHGQMYDKFAYPDGTLHSFLAKRGIRV